jgi:hypothetical protein
MPENVGSVEIVQILIFRASVGKLLGSFNDVMDFGHVLLCLPNFGKFHAANGAKKLLLVGFWAFLSIVDMFDMSREIVVVQESFPAELALLIKEFFDKDFSHLCPQTYLKVPLSAMRLHVSI